MDRKKFIYLTFLSFIVSLMISILPSTQYESKIIPQSSSYQWNNPTYIPYNTWTNLADTDNDYFNYIDCFEPVLVELNLSACNNYIDFYVFTDTYYTNQVFYRKLTSTFYSPIYFQNQETFYYLKTKGGLSGCGTMVPSKIVVRKPSSAITYNTNYSQTIDHVNPTLFYANLERGMRYKVNFTRSTPNTDIQFSFIYADLGQVTRDYENITLYNNGEFTATKNIKALLILKSYQKGSYDFNFRISELYRETAFVLDPEVIMIFILALVGAAVGILQLIRNRQLR